VLVPLAVGVPGHRIAAVAVEVEAAARAPAGRTSPLHAAASEVVPRARRTAGRCPASNAAADRSSWCRRVGCGGCPGDAGRRRGRRCRTAWPGSWTGRTRRGARRRWTCRQHRETN
jgi:hypothetical protein